MKIYLASAILFAASIASAQWTKSVGDFGGIVETIVPATGTNQPLLAGSNGGGVFISTDQGMHWSATANVGLTDRHVHALLSQAGAALAGTDAGIFLSTNNGAIWLPASTGQINKDTVNALFLKGDTIFAGTSHGVYRATRATLSWQKIDTGFTDDYHIHTFFLSDTNLLAGTFEFGVWRSTDNGSHWDQSNSGLTKSDMHAFVQKINLLLVGTDGGLLFSSQDNGHSWQSYPYPPSGSIITSLLINNRNLIIGSDAGVFVQSIDWLYNISFNLPTKDIRYLYKTGPNIITTLGDSTLWFIDSTKAGVKTSEKNTISLKNYPNPFSNQTTIKFSSSAYGLAKVSIVNILGEEVAQLFNGQLETGDHSFNWDAKAIAPGMYWCIINIGGEIFRLPLLNER